MSFMRLWMFPKSVLWPKPVITSQNSFNKLNGIDSPISHRSCGKVGVNIYELPLRYIRKAHLTHRQKGSYQSRVNAFSERFNHSWQSTWREEISIDHWAAAAVPIKTWPTSKPAWCSSRKKYTHLAPKTIYCSHTAVYLMYLSASIYLCCMAIMISITTVILIHIQIQADSFVSDTNGFINFWLRERYNS